MTQPSAVAILNVIIRENGTVELDVDLDGVRRAKFVVSQGAYNNASGEELIQMVKLIRESATLPAPGPEEG